MGTLIKASDALHNDETAYSYKFGELTWKQNVKPAQGKKFTLSELQRLVNSGEAGGRIENMPVHPKRKEKGISYLCNEEGVNLKMPKNRLMSIFLGYDCVGDILRLDESEWS